jgi:hypothetical protein
MPDPLSTARMAFHFIPHLISKKPWVIFAAVPFRASRLNSSTDRFLKQVQCLMEA